MFAFHLQSITFPENVIKFLLRHKSISIWVYCAYRQSNLLKTVVFEQNLDHFIFGQSNSVLNSLVNPMTVKVSHIAR